MWPRVVEFMLACWLAMSPFIFNHAADAEWLWYSDLSCAAIVATASLCCYYRPLQRAHLVTLAVALWLLAFGRFAASHPHPAGLQNNMVVGLLLLMFSVIPSHAEQPAARWFTADFEARHPLRP